MANPANGSRHSMALVAEVSPGITPAEPVFTPIRNTGTTLGLTKESIQSEELRADRQIVDMRHGNEQVGGDISCELSYGGAFDTMLEAVLCGGWNNDQLTAGVTRRSFTIERHFSDIEQYLRYVGCEFNTWNLTVAPNAMVTTTFSLVGRSQVLAQAALAGSTYEGATTGAPFDSFSGTIMEGGEPIAIVTELALTLENGLAPLFAVGSKTTQSISIARSNLTGTMTVWFESESLYQKFLNEIESSIDFSVSDGENIYSFQLPRVKYISGQPDVSGEGEVTLPLQFQALYDGSSGSQITIYRGAA